MFISIYKGYMRLMNYYLMPFALSVMVNMVVVAAEVSKDELAIPSKEMIKSFVTTVKEKPNSKTSFQFNAFFKPAVLPARSMEIYRSKGKIPFAISVELLKKADTEDGQESQNVFEGVASIVVVDDTGKIVTRKQEDMSALCPS
jgi:S1-C subfamily serine protease